MFFDHWEYITWIAKLGLYCGTAFVIGGLFCYISLKLVSEIKIKLIKYIALGAMLGALSSIFSFLFLVGSFSNTGLLGIFDSFYFNFLIHTSVGQVHLLRIFCFVILCGLLLFKLSQKHKYLAVIWQLIFLILFIPILISFAKLGHVANFGTLSQLLISLHVLAVSIWMGSLYPLWLVSQNLTGKPLQESMIRFGHFAIFMVTVLLICGISIALSFFHDWKALINTAYGQGFIVKILLACSILLLAACNKLYFTPRLQQAKYAKQLRYCILLEIGLGLLILMITGYITTVIGME
ncbi:copper resistance protein CopD [Acinetobacter sp. 2JN-4]|uniref:copper resistance D family protein n=1 Tax=Acinetobacter sp. 2JN-4 TaxID=2479844 RepID=UPI000EF9990F|nr:CopD family protein [Acinetobacter sp. 2JN-4]RLZ09554.1 copper resistance protein CopD [Acinetobacter sp. 2JN-4]